MPASAGPARGPDATLTSVLALPRLRPRTAVLGGLGFLLLIVLLMAWRAWQVRSDLDGARTYGEALRSSLDRRDLDNAQVAMQEFQKHADAADSGTHGPTWWLVSHLPVVGDDAAAVATVARAMGEVADAAAPVLDQAAGIDAGSMRPVDGRIPMDPLRQIAGPVATLSRSVADATRSIEGLDGSYIGPLARARTQAADLLSQVQPQLATAATVVRELPDFLGADRPKRYLVVFQNNGEIRATGGLPGSGGELVADDGRLQLVRTFSPVQAQQQTPARFSFTPAEDALYGPYLSRYPGVFLNSMPDDDRAVQLFADGARTWLGHSVDGVLMMDTVTLSYLLEATGPVEVKGVRLDARNAVDQLLYGTYARYATNPEQDAFFEATSSTIFDRLTTGSPDAGALVSALRRSFSEGRSHFGFLDSGLRPLGTALSPEPGPATMRIGFNDVGSSKLSYYLRTKSAVSTSCTASGSVLTGSATLTSTAPADVSSLPAYFNVYGLHWQPVSLGGELVQTVLALPRGMSARDVTIDDAATTVRRAMVDGREVLAVQVDIAPGATHVVRWTARGSQQAAPSVVVTPGVVAGAAPLTETSTGCS